MEVHYTSYRYIQVEFQITKRQSGDKLLELAKLFAKLAATF